MRVLFLCLWCEVCGVFVESGVCGVFFMCVCVSEVNYHHPASTTPPSYFWSVVSVARTEDTSYSKKTLKIKFLKNLKIILRPKMFQLKALGSGVVLICMCVCLSVRVTPGKSTYIYGG